MMNTTFTLLDTSALNAERHSMFLISAPFGYYEVTSIFEIGSWKWFQFQANFYESARDVDQETTELFFFTVFRWNVVALLVAAYFICCICSVLLGRNARKHRVFGKLNLSYRNHNYFQVCILWLRNWSLPSSWYQWLFSFFIITPDFKATTSSFVKQKKRLFSNNFIILKIDIQHFPRARKRDSRRYENGDRTSARSIPAWGGFLLFVVVIVIVVVCRSLFSPLRTKMLLFSSLTTERFWKCK